jgi:hypothetical protein
MHILSSAPNYFRKMVKLNLAFIARGNHMPGFGKEPQYEVELNYIVTILLA